jgi:hypothetical protein
MILDGLRAANATIGCLLDSEITIQVNTDRSLLVTGESSWVTILDRSIHSHEGTWIGNGSRQYGGHSKFVSLGISRGLIQAKEMNYDSGIADTRDFKCNSTASNLTFVNENITSNS